MLVCPVCQATVISVERGTMDTLRKAISDLKTQKAELEARVLSLDCTIASLTSLLNKIKLDTATLVVVEKQGRSSRRSRMEKQLVENSNEFLLYQYALNHGNRISPHEARDVLLSAKPGSYLSPRTAKGAAASVLCRSRKFERVSVGVYRIIDC